MAKVDKRGLWWGKLSQKQRSAVGQRAVQTRKRNDRLEDQLIKIAAKLGSKRARAVFLVNLLDAVS